MLNFFRGEMKDGTPIRRSLGWRLPLPPASVATAFKNDPEWKEF